MRLKNLLLALVFIVALAVAISIAFSFLNKKKELLIISETTNANQTQNANQTKTEEKLSRATLPSPPRPKILSRQEWNAKDARGQMQPHTLQHITIHHTASPQKEGITIEKKMQNLQNFSQSESRLASGKNKPLWSDVPYHYYIAVDGQIAEGRDIKYVGDTNTDYDPSGHALVVLEGNFEKEQPSSKQLESLYKLVAWLSANYEIPISEIKAHNDYASTVCPGKNLKNYLPTLREKVGEARSIADKK